MGKTTCGLLLDFLRTGDREDVSGKPAQLDDASWSELILDADKHRVSSLLYWRLKDTEPAGNVMVDAMAGLRHAYYAEAARALLRRHGLSQLLSGLHEAGVPVIVLKGAFLSEVVYPNIALRSMGDVDLLVPRVELPRAQAILLDMGYGPQEREDIEILCRKSKHLAQFVREDSIVELHWSIANPTGSLRIDIAGLWQRAQPAAVAGVQVLALSPEDLLLHLCLHASQNHSFECGLGSFCDIAEVIRHYGSKLDLHQFVDRAHEWGAARYAGLTLHLARGLLTVPVPDDALSQLVPRRPDSWILKKATECVLAQERYGNWALLPFQNQWGDKTTWEKVKALWDVFFPLRGEMAERYPRARDSKHLWPYYVRRLVDLPRKYGRATLRQAFRMMRIHKRDSTPSLARWLRSGKP
ncbi:MAG: nucleotidyltransferase family protein [candidate division WOR-3 bacterium]|nr:nucleotidyltransferase family protein [candidate division WOR-3 bacterium]